MAIVAAQAADSRGRSPKVDGQIPVPEGRRRNLGKVDFQKSGDGSASQLHDAADRAQVAAPVTSQKKSEAQYAEDQNYTHVASEIAHKIRLGGHALSPDEKHPGTPRTAKVAVGRKLKEKRKRRQE